MYAIFPETQYCDINIEVTEKDSNCLVRVLVFYNCQSKIPSTHSCFHFVPLFKILWQTYYLFKLYNVLFFWYVKLIK